MCKPSPIITSLICTPDLKELLYNRSIASLSRIIRQNMGTIFLKEAPLLSEFRTGLESATATESSNVCQPSDRNTISTSIGDEHLAKLFFKTVPISSYEDYRPFVSRFFSEHPQLSSIRDLLSPGFPRYIAHSSGTTEGQFKIFPKYPDNLPSEQRGGIFANLVSDVQASRAWCSLGSLRYRRVIEILDDLGSTPGEIKRFPVCQLSVGTTRATLQLDSEPIDKNRMQEKTWPGTTSPLAVWFVPSYAPCLLMHAQFAVLDPALSFIQGIFASLVYDFVRVLEEHWDILVQAIEEGTLPSVYESDLEEVKPYLEAQLKPNPTRAAELREIKKGTEGWLRKVWPSIKSIEANVSGVYAGFIPKLQYHFGSEIEVHSFIYGSTECLAALPYDPCHDTNLFKVSKREYLEYIEVEVGDSAHSESICSAWDLEAGKKYEILVTNPDGLWRYRLGDIIQVAGFGPTDGQPLIRFVERRGVGFRIASEFVTETELHNAIDVVSRELGDVLEFTVEMDIRKSRSNVKVAGYGFLVEVNDMKTATLATTALTSLQAHLLATNEGYRICSTFGNIATPTIRLLAPGTFQRYREWRNAVSEVSMAQIKVAVVIKDAKTRDWFMGRVVGEVEVGEEKSESESGRKRGEENSANESDGEREEEKEQEQGWWQ